MRISIILFFVFTIAIATSCNYNYKKGSGKMMDITKNLNYFKALEVGNNIELEIIPSSEYKMDIHIDEAFAEDLDIKIRNEVLYCGLKDHVHFKGSDVTITLYCPTLVAVKASGASSVSSDGLLRAEMMNLVSSGASELQLRVNTEKTMLECSGSSDAEIEINTNELYVKESGASDVTLQGNSQSADFQVSGSSDLSADALVLDSLICDVGGNSDVSAYVNKAIGLDLSGNSDFKYKGSAVFYRQTISGNSSVSKD